MLENTASLGHAAIPEPRSAGAVSGPLAWNRGDGLMEVIASEEILEEAYASVCQRRREAPSWHDVWQLRWQWDDLKPRLRDDLLSGTFRLKPTRTVRLDAGTVEAWSSLDALVLKAVSLGPGRFLPDELADGAYNCGLKGAVKTIRAAPTFLKRGTDLRYINVAFHVAITRTT